MKKLDHQSAFEQKRLMKLHNARIKGVKSSVDNKLEPGRIGRVDLKKKQMEKDKNRERKHSDFHTKRRIDEYVSTIDNDGAYLLEWLRLLQQLQKQPDFSSKYAHIQSLYALIKKELPDLDLDDLPNQEELMNILKSKPELMKKLLTASTPKKRKRKVVKRKRGTGNSGKKKKKKKKGVFRKKRKGRRQNSLNIVSTDEKDKVATDSEGSDEEDGDEGSTGDSKSSNRTRERNEEVERKRFLRDFLPDEMQVDLSPRPNGGEDGDNNNKEDKKPKKPVSAAARRGLSKFKRAVKNQLERELEVKMAKEIWGFVYDQRKKDQFNNKGGVSGGRKGGNSSFQVGEDRNSSNNGSLDDGDDDSPRRKKNRFANFVGSGQSSSNRNMDDINEYSGDEDDGDGTERRRGNPQPVDENAGDMEDYSGDEEDGIGDETHSNDRTRKRKKKKKRGRPGLGDDDVETDEDSDDSENSDEYEDDDEMEPNDAMALDWASSPVPGGWKGGFDFDGKRKKKKRKKKKRRRKSNGEFETDSSDDEFTMARPDSSWYDNMQLDRGLEILNEMDYVFVGISMIWLKALAHRTHMFLFTPIISLIDDPEVGLRRGGIWGHLKCGVVPCDGNGKWLIDHKKYAVKNPGELIGVPFHFKILIQSLKGNLVGLISDLFTQNDLEEDVVEDGVRKRVAKTALFVKYSLEYLNDVRVTDSCERISRRYDPKEKNLEQTEEDVFRSFFEDENETDNSFEKFVRGETKNKEEEEAAKEDEIVDNIFGDKEEQKEEERVVEEHACLFKFEKEYGFRYVTKEVLFFLRNSAIRFEIFMKKKHFERARRGGVLSNNLPKIL